MHTEYTSLAIRQLRDHLLGSISDEKKLEHATCVERLLAELDPNRSYSSDFVYDRLSAFRLNGPRETSHHVKRESTMTGKQVQHDLRLLVEDVSDAANVPADAAGEPVLTIEELSREFNVSTKTISRWRKQGLVSRRFVFDGRKRVGFLKSSVARFVQEHEEQVRRGAQFSQMTSQEREMIIRRARRLALAGALLPEVIRRLARKTGRSVETIRYTLKQFDKAHPEAAIFPDDAAPLADDVRQRIFQSYRRGEPLETLARRFRRTKAGVKRIVDQVRAERVMDLPLDFIGNPQFAEVRTQDQEQVLLGPIPSSGQKLVKPRLPKGLPPYLASLYEVPLLTREQEAHLFRKMNYLKYKASQVRQRIDSDRPQPHLMEQVERLHEESVNTKNEITKANLRLVVSIAKRYVGPTEDFFDLVSDGNMSLIRAVEKFDFAQGNKFSTYASWAIMRNFARTIPNERRYHDRFRSSPVDLFNATRDDRSDQYEQETAQTQRESQVGNILRCLDEREQEIILRRFGLIAGHEPLTLKEVGAVMGVTKERVRQLEARAMSKLRKAAEDEQIEIPEPV